MGIVDWFKNDLNTEERTLTRDLLSVAVADGPEAVCCLLTTD